MKKSVALERLIKEMAENKVSDSNMKKFKKMVKESKEDSINVSEEVAKRLKEKDVRNAVKNRNWVYVVNSIEGFFSDSDSGKWGKILEIIVKLYLIGYRGNSCFISPRGSVDVYYKGRRIEIKSNCGYIEDMDKSAMVIYSMDNKRDVYNPEQVSIFMVGGFWNMLKDLGLERMRKDRNGAVRLAIQSYNNSKRKTRALAECLNSQTSLKEFKDWAELKG